MIFFARRLSRNILFTAAALCFAAAAAQAQPALLSPPKNSFVDTTTPALLWEKSEDATVYVVTIFQDRRGDEQVVKFTVKGHSCLVTEGYLVPGETYWWHVAPRKNGVVTKPSQLWSFTVSKAKAAAPEETAAEEQPATEYAETPVETIQAAPETETENRVYEEPVKEIARPAPQQRTMRSYRQQEYPQKAPAQQASGGGANYPMRSFLVQPNISGLGIGIRNWETEKLGWDVQVMPSWEFNDFIYSASALWSPRPPKKSKWYLGAGVGGFIFDESLSLYGTNMSYKISGITFKIFSGWEWLKGIKKNQSLAVEAGLQFGSADYTINYAPHTEYGYTFPGGQMKGTFTMPIIYLGATYSFYYKR